MEAVDYLGDAQWGGLQQEGGLHQQHLVDVVDDGAAGNLTDDANFLDALGRLAVPDGALLGVLQVEPEEEYIDLKPILDGAIHRLGRFPETH